MPRFCANLGFLFGEVPFLDRFDAAARAGFVGVEYASPYDYPAAELRTRLKAAGLTQVLINSPAGNRAAGERGMACIPERAAVFRDSIHQAVDYAAALDCKLVHVMGGAPPREVAYDTAAALYAANLAWAAEQALSGGINPRDGPQGPAARGRSTRATRQATSCGPRNRVRRLSQRLDAIGSGCNSISITARPPKAT